MSIKVTQLDKKEEKQMLKYCDLVWGDWFVMVDKDGNTYDMPRLKLRGGDGYLGFDEHGKVDLYQSITQPKHPVKRIDVDVVINWKHSG